MTVFLTIEVRVVLHQQQQCNYNFATDRSSHFIADFDFSLYVCV